MIEPVKSHQPTELQPDPVPPAEHDPPEEAAGETKNGGPNEPHPNRLHPIDRQIALILGALALALYVRTLAPDVLPGDPGEFQTAAWRLGLSHPTGYPLYMLLGWLWQHMFALFGAGPAWSLNLFSAVCGAAGVSLLYRLMVQIMAGWRFATPMLWRVVGVYSATLLAINLTYWSQSLIAEVYTLHVVILLALLLNTGALARTGSTRALWTLALSAGLALTHHGMSLLLFPALVVYLFQSRARLTTIPWRHWLGAGVLGLLPLLLYLYIPLRSGPEASPWYHQPLGQGILTVYAGGWPAFWHFITGQSIAAGFRSAPQAIAQIPQAAWLWQTHFGWVGLASIGLGLIWLARVGHYRVLATTLTFAVLQQGFNLFYDIGDILVYYIPLYLIGALWAGMGLAGLASARWRRAQPDNAFAAQFGGLGVAGWPVTLALMLLALSTIPATGEQIDQSESRTARRTWETILAAEPPVDSILISNDRNEIVPLFYFQHVEARGQDLTGLFPGITPDARFADIGATVATALIEGDPQPVYLIKPMPGLAVRFDLANTSTAAQDATGEPSPPVDTSPSVTSPVVTSPLVKVQGPAAAAPPAATVDQPYGPLHLVGYDWKRLESEVELAVQWRVRSSLDQDYTATAQLFHNDNKLAQDDHTPGGVYYPTSYWKEGETLVVRHQLALDAAMPADERLANGGELLVGFYAADTLAPLAPMLTLSLPSTPTP